MDAPKDLLATVSYVFLGNSKINSLLVLKIFSSCNFTATEIQNIQIGDGDVPRDVKIPIYMIFPRLFSCPTLATSNFKIGIRFLVFINLTRE